MDRQCGTGLSQCVPILFGHRWNRACQHNQKQCHHEHEAEHDLGANILRQRTDWGLELNPNDGRWLLGVDHAARTGLGGGFGAGLGGCATGGSRGPRHLPTTAGRCGAGSPTTCGWHGMAGPGGN